MTVAPRPSDPAERSTDPAAQRVSRGVGRDVSPGTVPAPQSLDIWVGIETPEQIRFSYSIAGIGSRGAAAALDALIIVLVLALVFVAIAFTVGFASGAAHGSMTASRTAGWILAAYLLLQFAVMWGYYVLFEGLWDGQTPGKRLMQLRVVSDGGFSVSFAASAVRNLLRVVDVVPPPLYLVGIVSALLNHSRKRIGDLVAGTIVIKEGPSSAATSSAARTVHARHPEAVPRESGSHRGTGSSAGTPPTSGPAPGPAPGTAPVTARLSDGEYAVLETYMLRRLDLEPERRHALAAQLAQRLSGRGPVGVTPSSTPSPTASPTAALARLYESERAARASGVAARSDTGAHREQHAMVALGRRRWNDFAARLDRTQRAGLSSMQAEEVSVLVAEYREVASDLARLQTATRGRDSDALFFLGRLVARGHNLLYRQRRNTAGTLVEYFTRTVPSEVRRSWRQIGLAAVLLFGPAAAAYTAVVVDPPVAARMLPDEMLSRAATAAERERRGEGYVTIEQDLRPVAASRIISNNVQITYMAFALGLTAGIGTVILLVLNGVAIGSGVGLFAANGVTRVILAFVAPHGVLELSAICIAAGGGFLIAQGMLLPGNRTRRAALIANGRRGVNLIAASTLLLLVAGSIEGLVSPQVWPLRWKIATSVLTAAVLAGYLSLPSASGRRERDRAGGATIPTVP